MGFQAQLEASEIINLLARIDANRTKCDPQPIAKLNGNSVMISVIIPAHNESLVIARTLKILLAGAAADELDVVVVCNACTDDTAKIARSFGYPVRVVETEVGGKTHALNIGARIARTFPRIYVDADVEVSLEAIRAISRRLERGDVLAVAPAPCFDVSGC